MRPQDPNNLLRRHVQRARLSSIYAATCTLDKRVNVIEAKVDRRMAGDDDSGCMPLSYENDYSGSIEAVDHLVSNGADINRSLSEELHGPERPISKFIERVSGA